MSSANIKELQKKLKSLKEEAATLEAKCFTVLNEPNPEFYNLYTEYKMIQEERAAILKLFKVEDGDIVQLYKEYMDGIMKKQKMRQDALNTLKENMERLGINESSDPNAKMNNTFKTSVVNIKEILQELKKKFTAFYKQSISELRKAKLATRKIIDFKKDDAQKQLDKFDLYEKKIINKYGNSKAELEERYNKLLAARKIKTDTIFDDETTQEDLNYHVTQQTYNQLLPFKERMVKFTTKIDLMFSDIDIIDMKINKLQRTVDHLKASKAEKNAIKASLLFNKFSSKILKYQRQEDAIDAALKDIEDRKKEIIPVVEKEREISKKIVPGTNKTVRQLRDEIQRVIREIHSEILDKTQYIERIESAERNYTNVSDSLINELEDELAKREGK